MTTQNAVSLPRDKDGNRGQCASLSKKAGKFPPFGGVRPREKEYHILSQCGGLWLFFLSSGPGFSKAD